MGERLICIQEVSGSIPLGSTICRFIKFDLPGIKFSIRLLNLARSSVCKV